MTDRELRILQAYKRNYESQERLNKRAEAESARQRRLKELADEKRRTEDESLNKRLADTLDTPEYRPMPFGGEGYSDYNWQKQQEQEVQKQQEEPIKQVSKPTKAEPEIPDTLKDPRKQDINIDFRDLYKASFVPGTRKTSVASEDESKDGSYVLGNDGKWNKKNDPFLNVSTDENITDRSIKDTVLNSIKVAQAATMDLEGNVAEANFKSAMNDKADPQHANFWGALWDGFVSNLSSAPDVATSVTQAAKKLRNDWSRLAVGRAAIEKNTVEVSSDSGQLNRYQEMIRRGEDMIRWTDNVMLIVDLTDKLNQLKQLPASKDNNQLMVDVMNKINQLKEENIAARKQAKDASTYYTNKAPQGISSTSGLPLMNYNQKPDAAMNLDVIDRLLADTNYNISDQQRKSIQTRIDAIRSLVDDKKQEYNKERPKLLNRMADNIRELRSWTASEYNPSKEFTEKADAVTEFNFTDPDTYIYGMPGLIGSSMSFGGYQLASTALGLTAAAIGTFATGGLATGALVATSAASTGLGIAGGHYENTAEVADNYMQAFLKKLNDTGNYEQWKKEGVKALGKKDASDQEIMWAMSTGVYEPKEKIKDIAEIATYGVNNLYKDDMTAVVGNEIFEAGLNFFGPIAKMAKSSMVTPGAKATRFKRMYNFLHENPNAAKYMNAGRDFLNKMGESEVGAAIASSVAFPLGVVGKAVEAGVRSAIPKSATRFLGRKLGFIADIIEKAPEKAMMGKVLAKNTGEYISKVLGSSWSEAIEEGKQYLNGKKFLDGSYAGESDTLMDSIINDIAGGSRAAYSFVGDMFGATADKELIANMKGGFLGGFGHTALISGVNYIADTAQDMRATDFVVNNVLAQKLADRTTISNNAYLATQTSPSQYARIMNAFDNMEKIAEIAEERNGDTEGLNFTAQDAKEQREAYQKVFDFANRENVKNAARSLNITPGSKDYGTFVGLAMWAKDLQKDALKSISDLSKKELQVISSWISGIQNDERSLSQVFESMSYADLQNLQKALDLPETELLYETAKDGNQTISIPDTAGQMAGIQEYAQRAIYMQKYLANLDALFTLRDQLEQRENPTTADKRRLRSINRQIRRLKESQTNEILKNIETAQDMERLIVDTKVHEVLRDMYRDSSNYTVDLEEGVAMEYMLLGKGISGVQFLTSPQMQQALLDVQNEIKNRESGAKTLINQYNYSLKQDEELLQLIHDIFEELAKQAEDVQDLENVDVTEQEQPQEMPVEPVSEPSNPIVEPEPTVIPEEPETPSEEPEIVPEDEHDLDEQVRQLEAANAPSTNTMFTADEVNSDFGISSENWSKVSQKTHDEIDALQKRYERFVAKWNGKPATKSQYNGVHGNVVKMQREFDILRERAQREVEEWDSQHNQPITYKDVITDDSIWEQLHPEILIEKLINGQFDEQVTTALTLWNRFINRPFGSISNEEIQEIQQALVNAEHILQYVDDNQLPVNIDGYDTFERLKFDVTEFLNSVNRQLPPPPPNITPTVTIPEGQSWTHYTTTHTGSTASRGYNVEDSVAIDDKSIRFQDVSADPNFVQDAVIWFTLRPNGRSPKIQMNVIYKGHQFTPIDIHTGDSKEGKDFWVTAVKMIQGALPGQFVMPQKAAIRRSNGIIDNGPLITMEQAGFLTDDNIYSIAFTNSQDTYCIVKYEKGADGRDVPVAYVPGQEAGISKHEVYRYSDTRDSSTKPADGGLVMMVRPPYPTAENDSRVPVNIHYSPITDGDAQLIVDLLSGEYMSDSNDYGSHAMENQVFTENGVGKGLTRMQVLRMLIRYKSSQQALNPYEKTLRYVEYDPQDQRIVILHGNFGEGVEIPRSGRFDITNKELKEELKLFLKAHHNRTFTYNEFLRCNISENNNDFRHPLHGLVEFSNTEQGKQLLRNNGQITFGNSSIVFDSKDLGDNQHPAGISGLAWGMRRGFVQVKFIGFKNTLLNFDTNVPLVYNNQQQPSQLPEQPKQPSTKQILDEVVVPEETPTSLEDYDWSEENPLGMPMRGERANVKFDKEKAKAFIEKFLGEELEDDSITDRIEEIARSSGGLLGFCHYSGKLLFDPYAPQGTMYHEAFHKLLELVVGDRTRMMLYKAYAKKMHIKYKDNDDLSKNREVQEGLAEEFRYYMENRPTIKLASLRHPFKMMKQVATFMHNIGSYRLYTFYVMSRLGLTKKLFKANAAKTARFLENLGPYAPFKLGNYEFKHILNRYQYRQLRNTLTMLVFSTNNIGIAGENIENLRISKAAIKNSVLYQKMINSNASGALALEELVDHIEEVEEDLKSYFAQTMEINKNKHEDEDNIEEIEGGENATEVALGNHIRESKEFSQFSRVSQKVKFLFARIPKVRFGYEGGKKVRKSILNDEGLFEYFDAKYVFNVLVNRCHDCRSSQELLNRLAKLSTDNAMIEYVYNKIIQPLYQNAQKGDADAEAVFAQMLVSLHAAKGEYVIGKARRSTNGTWSVIIERTDSDYNAREYKTIWSNLFANGAEYLEKTSDGYLMKYRKGTQKRYSPEVFHNIYLFLNNLRNAVKSENGSIDIMFAKDGKLEKVNRKVNNVEDFDHIKYEFCNTLQKLGIQFTKDELDYMLLTMYESSDYTAFNKLLERTDKFSITPFLDWINGCYNPVTKSLNVTKDGTLNGKKIDTALSLFGFVGLLADLKYKYSHDHDQLSVLATKGNRYYVISENNLITDITDDLNASLSGDVSTINDFKSFSYNYMERYGVNIGSLVIKLLSSTLNLKVSSIVGLVEKYLKDSNVENSAIRKIVDNITNLLYKHKKIDISYILDENIKNDLTGIINRELQKRIEKISVHTVAGFRTDQKGDLGQDYAEISPMEDYITKLQILMQGGLIFPTMSDKKTWTYLKGLDMPWIDFVGIFQDLGNGKYTLSQDRNALQQLVEYAYCELDTIQKTLKQLRGYTDELGTKHPPLKESEKVLNFHTNKEEDKYNGHTIIQGARFGSLTGIYDKDGNWVSFNRIHEEGSDKYIDELLNWRVAQEYFFGVPSGKPGQYFLKTKANDRSGTSAIVVDEQGLKEHQFELLSRSLLRQAEKELEYAAKLGLIERVSTDSKIPVILQYRNKMLDKQLVDSIAAKITGVTDALQRESIAIATLLNRASVSSIISLQEVERLYAGHPAFFKWKYNEKGDLVDRSVDQHKRLGGLISTGQNNVLDIPGIPDKYTCAEVDNEMVGSSIQDSIKTMMEDGELRSAYIRMISDRAKSKDEEKQLVSEIENMSLDEIKLKLEAEHPDMYKILTKNAQKKANDFVKDIDVADGAAYVTDEMCEWMLRMVGSWDKKVERAFKILRGEEVDGKRYTPKDIRELSLAYKDVLTTVIGNQKYTAYGFRFANGIAAAYYDKMALFPMFKSISVGPSAKIFLKMKDEGVHMLMINSAVKVGSLGSIPMTMSDFRVDNDPTNEANFKNGDIGQQDWKPSFENNFHFNTYELKFKYIRKQFNTDPKEAATTKMGTQMTKVAMANLIPGRDYLIVEGVDENGNKTYTTASGTEVRNDIMNCINEMSNIGEKKVRERFIVETKDTDEAGNEYITTSVNIKELSKFLREELASRGASQESIEAVSLALDQDGEYTMYIPPVAQNSLDWILSIITSMINKNVIDINTPGGAFIQRSVWSMEGPTTVQNVEDLPESIYEGRELQMINEEGTMDCVLSLDFFEDIIPQDVVRDSDGNIVYKVDDAGNFITNKDGNRVPETQPKSFKDARQWLIDNNIISGRKSNGKWSNATANIVGSRIPTQAPSSIHALRCVDVLEVVRDTIVLPKEFTKITGADFDIDKLFLSRFFYKKQGKSVTSTFEKGSYEYYANRLLSNYIALLKDSKSKEEENFNRTAHSNHASIDGDTKLLKDIIKDLEEGKEKEALDPFTPYSLWANASTKTEFITGKFGIGPFALNNNSHILTMLYGVKFKDEGFMSMLGARRLDISIDRYGNSILSWLSGLINAHVDVAKDPYISRLNVNTYTYNLVNLMIRTGFGKDTFYFTTQPIMKDLAQAYQNAASQFGSEMSGSKYRRQKEACNKVMFEFLKKNFKLPTDVTGIDKAMKVMQGYFNKVVGISMESAVKELLSKDNDILHQISKKQIPANGKAKLWEIADGIKLSTAEVQTLVYFAKTQFEPYEQNLSNLVKYSKIDTKKQGKNITEQIAYRDGVNDLFDIKNGKYGLFEDLREYYTASYIQLKTDNALNLFRDILGEFTIESTIQFQSQVRKVMNAIGEFNPSADMYRAVTRLIMNYIRAGFFNKWAEDNGINIKALVNGDNTISDRLEDIRVKIMTDPAYADMLAKDGSIKNYLLRSLVQGFEYHYSNRMTIFNVGTQPDTHPNAKFIKTLNFMDADHVNEDDMTEAWDELLNDESHKDIKDFARDLIMYAFITSGGNSGNNLFKYIPNSWKLNSYGQDTTEDSYAQYMLNQLDMYKNAAPLEELPLDVDEIVLNNWFDNKFISTVDADGFDKYYTQPTGWVKDEKGIEHPTGIAVPVIILKKNADIDKFSDEKYIKVRRDCADQHSQRNYTIYKKVAYTADGLLIYAMVDPKGNQFPQGNTIYEMRRSDTNRKESAVFSAASAEFTQSIGIAKKGMNIEGSDLASILWGLITKIRDIDVLPTKEKMVDLFTQDPELNQWIRSAVFLDSNDENSGSLFIKAKEYYSRQNVELNKDVLHIFTDNTDRNSGNGIIDPNSKYAKKYGQGHHFPTKTSAVIRGLDNAMPISTQRYYHPGAIGEQGRWTDEAFDEFKTVVDDEIKEIKKEWATGKYKYVVYPQLFNTKISNISEERTPKIYLYLKQAITDLELFINTGTDSSKQEAEETGARTYRPGESSNNKLNSSSVKDVYDLLKRQYSENSSESKLTDLVFGALENSNIEFVAENLGPGISGRFIANENKILYNSNPEYIQSNTLLHEAIHAATSYYLKTANRDKLSLEIRIAIEEIEECYNILKDDFIKQHFYENGLPKVGVNIEESFEFWILDDDTYGYTNPAEMVAELGKPSFVEHIKDFDRRHKGENIFQRLISAIAQLFGITKEYKSLEKTIKDALVVLLTNPNKELMDRYALENNNIKVNHKALNDCKHIEFVNRRAVLKIFEELPEDGDDEYFDTVMKLPKHLAPSSLEVPDGAHHPLTQSRKGAIFVFERSLFFTLNGYVIIDDEFVNVPIRIYSKQALQNNVFEISTGENGIDYLSKITPLFENLRYLTKTETSRLKLKTKAYELLNRAKEVIRRGSKYFIQKGESTYNKNRQRVYKYKNESISERFEKIKQLLRDNNINPDYVLDGYNKTTGELYFSSVYDEDHVDDVLSAVNLYNLNGPDAFSELMRMLNDDKELFDEYWKEMRNSLGC